jgi:hypothetical protein
MKLRDRIRRWRSPAQWEDDHPAEGKQREQPKNAPGDDWVSTLGDWARRVADSNFRRPR